MVELEAKLGRYSKWVKRLGPVDVMIALTAKEMNAILATCDWRLAKLYSDLTGHKPIFIPVKVKK